MAIAPKPTALVGRAVFGELDPINRLGNVLGKGDSGNSDFDFVLARLFRSEDPAIDEVAHAAQNNNQKQEPASTNDKVRSDIRSERRMEDARILRIDVNIHDRPDAPARRITIEYLVGIGDSVKGLIHISGRGVVIKKRVIDVDNRRLGFDVTLDALLGKDGKNDSARDE